MSMRSTPWTFCKAITSTPATRPQLLAAVYGLRHASTAAGSVVTPKSFDTVVGSHTTEDNVNRPEPAFDRLPTKTLLRSIFLGRIFKTPFLYKPGIYILEKIANSKSIVLDADRNPLIRAVILPLVYRQFCAGRNKAEIQHTLAQIKGMGYSGVILCYSKEVMAKKDAQGNLIVDGSMETAAKSKQEIETWRDGNLATLDAVSEGDYIGVKFTGAGLLVSQGLVECKEPSPDMAQALHRICDKAKAEKKRLWIDAEQQLYHPGIDKWTIDLMRKYNRDGRVLVLTTIQSYLKSSRQTVEEYMRLAQKEGFSVGIKLVRGAYINSDVRSRIHDTKADTDASYNSITKDILTKSWPKFENKFPHIHLFVAGHNTESVRQASSLAHQLAESGNISERLHFGQLQGMADDVGCELLCLADKIKANAASSGTRNTDSQQNETTKTMLAAPMTYKCLTWGSIKDCLHYLVRRAIENQGAAERMNAGLIQMERELRRRILGF